MNRHEQKTFIDHDPTDKWGKWMMGAAIFALLYVTCIAVLDQYFWPRRTLPNTTSAQK